VAEGTRLRVVETGIGDATGPVTVAMLASLPSRGDAWQRLLVRLRRSRTAVAA
jgi:hypothetical protein